MKKLLLFLIVILVLFGLGVYVFIPAKLSITSTAVIKTTDIGTERFVIDEANWGKWWNYSKDSSIHPAPASFMVNGDAFKLIQKFYKSIDIRINHNSRELKSKLLIISLAVDSTGIEWNCDYEPGNNPFARLAGYFDARQLKKNMDEVLVNLKAFLSKNENVYGIPIERNHLKDTLYVTAKTILPTQPSNADIYALIKKIQDYAARNNVKQTGSPIYNVTEMENNRYQLMAGIPLDRSLKEVDGFSMKYMVKGSFIITEVVGGDYTVNKASESLLQYFQDFHKTSMAMNFTMLVTDRLLQPDSSKWITKLYQPVY